jgi:hypothetical protein
MADMILRMHFLTSKEHRNTAKSNCGPRNCLLNMADCFVMCLIALPMPPSKNPFAAKLIISAFQQTSLFCCSCLVVGSFKTLTVQIDTLS